MPDPRMPKGTRPITQKRLENIALHYLERFASSAENLRRVLTRRIERSVREHGTDRAEAAAWVDALITRYVASGLINDVVYAEARAASLHRRGASARQIRQTLAAKGVDSDLVDRALDSRGDFDTDGSGDLDFRAALALCRRRRLGPYRAEAVRAAHRDRDLAALGRAGFDYDTARRAVDGSDDDA